MENNNQPEEKEKSRKPILLILLLLLSLIGNVVLYMKWKNTKSQIEVQYVDRIKLVEDENKEVKDDLLELRKQYANLKTDDEALQADIDRKKSQIDSLIKQVQKYKGNTAIIKKLKAETETLRAIMQSYVRTIDSLNTLNITLVAEKKAIQGNLDKEKERSGSLEKEVSSKQEIINKAQELIASGISAKGVYFKRGGKKEVETRKAKKCEKIKVSFTLGENRVARAGAKDIYVRIITPDGKEMARSYDESYRFNFNKTRGYYAGKELCKRRIECSTIL
jgi:DNA repair exonuclease SbcCD ATPase subunit